MAGQGQKADSIRVLGRRLGSVMAEIEASLGEDAAPGKIPESESFLAWCERLADAGLVVDGKPFSLADRPALRPIFASFPSTIAEANRKTICVMKASQVGLTLAELLWSIYAAVKFEPCVVGMFMPDQPVALDKSNRRFLPILRSIPDIHRRLVMRTAADGSTVTLGEGNVLVRVLGRSALLFNWTSSAIGTESRPMDCISVDEVQGVSLEQIDRVTERMSASRIRFRLLLSTPQMPESDIHVWFTRGTQKTWHTLCPHCGKETDLSEHFPACVTYNYGQIEDAPIDYVYVCPDTVGGCGGWLPDSQSGRYIAQNPNAPFESFHLAQTASPTISPRDLIEAWNRADTGDTRANFAQRKLGRPWVDREQLPVTMEELNQCVADGVAAGIQWNVGDGEHFLGVDQMASHCCCVIVRRMRDGRMALVHVEWVQSLDPWHRVRQMMEEYKIVLCAVETLPNADSARALQADYPGRCYLIKYSGAVDADPIQWGDLQTRSDRRTAEPLRERYAATLNQFKMMQSALFRIKNRGILIPDPALLEQDVIEKGERKRILIAKDMFFLHLCKTALVVETDPNTRKPRPRVQKIGIDPHFAYGMMLVCVAYARNYGMTSWIMPGEEMATREPEPIAAVVERNYPGLPRGILALIEDGPISVCGRCREFDLGAGLCTLRGLSGAASDPSCDLFERR